MRFGKAFKVGSVQVRFVYFDSLGAKSACTLIRTPDVKILIDPGAAEMQPGYPLPDSEKFQYLSKALRAIEEAAKEADLIVISHYHYDHHLLPKGFEDVYRGKELWIKDPNQWINQSQWARARLFLAELAKTFKGPLEDELFDRPQRSTYQDPLRALPLARSKDYGDYQKRKEELLSKGRAWFERVAKLWSSEAWCKEFKSESLRVRFADGRAVKVGSTRIRFSPPLFHGLEYERTGWVIATVVECEGVKVVHSSDLQGPLIEDYAQWIVDENPDLLVLDGPTTYLFGYMLNRINLRRAVENASYIVEGLSDAELVIYDHHLLRDAAYRERVAPVYEAALKFRRKVLTAAEWLGRKPLILELTSKRTS